MNQELATIPSLGSPLGDEPPAWVSQYIGLEYVPGGRSRQGVDCYGLVWLLHREQLGRVLPTMIGRAFLRHPDCDRAKLRELRQAAQEAADAGDWTRLNEPEFLGDIAWMKAIRSAAHIGVAVSRTQLLQIEPGQTSSVTRIDSPAFGRRLVSWVRYSGSVTVSGIVRPFGDRIQATAPAGITIGEVLDLANIPHVDGVVVRIGEAIVPRDAWSHVRPLHGQLVTIHVAPTGGGGGKSPLRLIGTIAIIAAAAAVPALGALAGTAFAAGTIGGALLSAGITAAGYLLLNALAPLPKPRLRDSLADTQTSPSLTSSRNDLRPWGVIPQCLGTHRWAPPLGAVPYTEVSGDDQYLRVLYNLGLGPLDIPRDQIKIGDTKLDDLTDFQIEIRQGYPGEPEPTLYPNTIVETPLSVLLDAASSWVVRTTAIDAEEISIDVTFPQGLATYNTDGSRANRTVNLEVEYSAAGAGVWKQINPTGSSGSPTNFLQLDYLFRQPEATPGGSGFHSGRVAWDADQVQYPDAKPAYLPASGFSWEVTGYIYTPTTGAYSFQVDGSDACDVHVDWQVAASWYGSHGPEVTAATVDSGTHRGSPINLTKGYHAFRARVECRTAGGGTLAVAWRKPGDSAFSLIPSTSFFRSTLTPGLQQVYVSGQLEYRWFTFGGYGSGLVITEATGSPLRKSLAWAVPKGQYDVRIRRTTADTSATNIIDKVYWTTLRTIRPGSPTRLEGCALIALRIKATDQLQGTLEELNVLTTSIVPDWDSGSGTWIQRPTDNAASLLRHVLQGKANRRPMTDAKIDLASLQVLHGDGYRYDAIIDQERTVFEQLREIASAARSRILIIDGKVSAVRDRVRSTPVQHFTPRNSRGFRWRKIFAERVHGLRVAFVNADKDYKDDERIVYADGYDANNATKFRSVECPGVVRSDEVWKWGRYQLAVEQLRPEIIQLDVSAEHLICNSGDMVLVAHDVMLIGYCSGRVTRLIKDGGGALIGVHVDEACPMAAGDTHAIRIRRKDGTIALASVVTEAGNQTRLLFASPLSPACDPGDLYSFGKSGLETREYIVVSLKHSQDLTATLELVDHAPAVHSADTGTIPPYDSGTTRPPDYNAKPEAPIIESIRSDDYVMVRQADGSLSPRMLITLRRPSGSKPIPVGAVVRTRPKPPSGPALGPWLTRPQSALIAGTVSVDQVEEGITYELAIRVVTAKGVASDWTFATHTIVGKTAPPPDVVTFDATRLADGTRRYVWDLGNEPPDVAGVLLRVGAVGSAWGAMSPLVDGVLEGASPFDTSAPLTSGLLRFAIKMIDTSGNESPNMVWVERDLGAPPLADTVISEDARRLGWPGSKGSCIVATYNVLEATDSTTWSSLTSWTAYSRWNLNPASPISYTHGTLDLGVVFPVEPAAYVLADGSALVEVAWDEVSSTPTNWTAISSLAGTAVRGRYFRFRVTITATVSQPVPVIREFSMYIRAKQLQHEINDANTASFDSVRRLGPGRVRLPIPEGLFTQIRRVSLSFNGSGQGWTWEVVDKDPALGPLVYLYDTNGNFADATIDAVVRGL